MAVAWTYQVRDEDLRADLERHVRVRDGGGGGGGERDEGRAGHELERIFFGGDDEAVARAELKGGCPQSYVSARREAGGGKRRTFIAASSPVESGIANAGPFPPELAVAMASVSDPSCLITNDWTAPSVFSLVALHDTQDVRRDINGWRDALENAIVRGMQRYPRRVRSGWRLAQERQGAGVRVEEV